LIFFVVAKLKKDEAGAPRPFYVEMKAEVII